MQKVLFSETFIGFILVFAGIATVVISVLGCFCLFAAGAILVLTAKEPT